MLKDNSKFTRKKALVIIAAAVLLFGLLILGKGLLSSKKSSLPDTLEGRIGYLQSFGWEVDAESENAREIKLPSEFGGVMEEYCKIQRSQGFELEKYRGKECTQYTYRLLNYGASPEDVYITVYVYKNTVIAGDIHTVSSAGFMHGFIRAAGI